METLQLVQQFEQVALWVRTYGWLVLAFPLAVSFGLVVASAIFKSRGSL